jgi:hypothetical protein
MDVVNAGGIAGIVGLALSVGGTIFTIINHKRCRSRCCNWTGEVSFDVGETTPVNTGTPPNEKPFLKV